MRLIALLYAMAKMVSTGHLYSCDPVWTWGPKDGLEPTEESVACGRREEPVDPALVKNGHADKLVWYEIMCTSEGCWP